MTSLSLACYKLSLALDKTKLLSVQLGKYFGLPLVENLEFKAEKWGFGGEWGAVGARIVWCYMITLSIKF